jgi:hypothetical protein
VLREEVHADYDSFDMGYYAYGLSLYGNMPLIEPLETRDTYKNNKLPKECEIFRCDFDN